MRYIDIETHIKALVPVRRRLWGMVEKTVNKNVMKDSYYDGPVRDSGRTLEEIEKDIQEEKERCAKLSSWDEILPSMV